MKKPITAKTQGADLKRSLGITDSTSLVIGTMIGTGIFLKAATMSQLLPNSFHVFLAWGIAGLLSLIGALVYSELGELFPEAGGEFIYLKETYGDGIAFLYGWQRFWISSPATIAAYGVGAATFLTPTLPNNFGFNNTLIAFFFITFFSVLNCFSVYLGGKIQTFLTALKLFLIFGLAFGILFFTKESANSFSALTANINSDFTWSAFGTAVIAALWAFDGWNNLPMAAGEVKSPSKTIPLALIIGTGLVFIIYIITNYSFFYVLPVAEIQAGNSALHSNALPVATIAAQKIIGDSGIILLSVAFVLSALGAMNGSILTSARVPYSMAHLKLFPKLFTILSNKKSPYVSILIQAFWACVLASSGSFDQLTDYVVFSSWIFYVLNSLAVIKLRKTLPHRQRTYKVPFYPILPLIFSVCAFLLLVNTLIEAPKESGIGLLLILAGVPFYYFFRKK